MCVHPVNYKYDLRIYIYLITIIDTGHSEFHIQTVDASEIHRAADTNNRQYPSWLKYTNVKGHSRSGVAFYVCVPDYYRLYTITDEFP
ncbi:hypothetical protein GCM10027341_03870 [Spirosoma knui]